MLERYARDRGLVAWMAVVVAGAAMAAEVPRMLPREIHSETVLVKDGAPEAVIATPDKGPWSETARQVRDSVLAMTGARLPILSPAELCQVDGLMLKDELKRKAVIFVGNLAVNSALFEPYLRRWFVVDEESPGTWTAQTFPNPWGTGVGYAIVGGSAEAEAATSAETFAALCKKHLKGKSIALPRVCEPGPDLLLGRARYWRRLAKPANQDLFPGLKQATRMHLGYSTAGTLLQFTLITDLGALSADEVNDIENEVLENLLMIPEKVWWHQSGGGFIGGRHELYKNPRFYLAAEHLLTVGKPNAAARRRLEEVARGPLEYMRYATTKAYRSDHEGIEDGHAWQSVIWFALLRGDWDYFESGRAREAALYGLHQTDNLGGLAGHIQYGGVTQLDAVSTVRNALRTAAWRFRDGRFRWLLEHMPFSAATPYGFAVNLPIDDVEPQEPRDLLGVQWLPISPHSYTTSVGNAGWQQPGIARDRTVDLLTFRDGYGPDDQYLCLDGFQNQQHPLGLGSVLRYVDRGKLFLVAHTGKEGNYYKSGLVVSPGVCASLPSTAVTEADRDPRQPEHLDPECQVFPEPWGAELAVAADLPAVGFAALRAPNYYGAEWARHIVWKKGRYFVFMDVVRAPAKGEYMITAVWRTCSPAELHDQDWVQKQEDVTFFLKPAFSALSRAGKAPVEEYQNELVPWLLRQTVPLKAEKAGDGAGLQNLLYASSPGREQAYEIRRLSQNCVMVRGTDELAVMGFGASPEAGINTDAQMYYLSADKGVIAGGGGIALGGIPVLGLQTLGNVQRALPSATAKSVTDELERLWADATPGRGPDGTRYPRAKLKQSWRFDGFRKHPARLRPRDIRSQQGEWWADLGRSEAVAKVVVAPSGRGASAGAILQFSRDNFRRDFRAGGEPAISSRIVGPHGKSFFSKRNLLSYGGGLARYVCLTLPKGVSVQEVEILSKKDEPADIVEMRTCDLIADDGRGELLCRTRDNQLALLSEDGKLLWRQDFEHNLLTVAVLDLDESGRSDVFAVDAGAMLWRFGPDGQLRQKIELVTKKEGFPNFFRYNRAYSLGVWKPKRDGKPNLVLGTYQCIAWIKPDGEIVAYPEVEKFHQHVRTNYFVMRGLVYWDRALPRGLDVNGDGIEDQVFLSRGWAAIPTLMFFGGKELDAIAEYKFRNSRTLGLEIVELGGDRRIFAANELSVGLYSLKAKELWSLRFGTPAVDYAVTNDAIIVAKRDGMVVRIDKDGKVTHKCLLRPELRSVAAGDAVMVAGDDGVFCMNHELGEVSLAPLRARHLVSMAKGDIAAALEDGRVVLFSQ